MLMDDVRGEVVLRRLPPDILRSLSGEQVAAIRNAAGSARARRHPIDARFGLRLPLLGRSYLVLLIGKDMRSPKRRLADRKLRPTDRLGHLVLALLGVAAFLLAVLIVHNDASDRSLMPWIIASQAIPILAIAPILVVVMYNVLTGDNLFAHLLHLSGDTAHLISKALVSTYLSFFPVVVGMVKGFRSPEMIQLDLLRTYNASRPQAFWKLRLPIAVPYLFTSMKVAVAAALVGAIVGELPTGASAGIGARLLTGSYYGQTTQIWAALLMGALLAGILVALVGVAERLVVHRMGVRP